ncbi:MAG: hypothetical protein A2X49_15610 [Lentisphaerae bacterium GWF2_52_8]|nr:MAG: hypothetical protein A2X49_15610 [Lentisphaerae bacterium GWF2_52_8]
MRKSGLILLLALAVSFTAYPLLSQESQRGVKFSKALNSLAMFDYSEMFLLEAISKNPSDVDRLRIQLADTYIQWGKGEKGDEIISKVSPESPFYANGQLVLGQAAFAKGKLEMGVSFFEKYIDFCKKSPPASDEDKQDFRIAVAYLSKGYTELKKPGKAKEVMDIMEKILKTDSREASYYEQMSVLNVAEKMKEDTEGDPEKKKECDEKWAKILEEAKKKAADKNKEKKGPPVTAEDMIGLDKTVWQSVAYSTLKPLRDLRWGGQDSITAFSYGAAARALYILGKYDDALKEFEIDTMGLVSAVDDAFGKDEKGLAPGALMNYMKGRIYLAQAKAASDDKAKQELYVKALKSYLNLMMKYKKYEHEGDAYSEFLSCKEILEKQFGKKITLPANFVPPKQQQSFASSTPPEADRLFRDEKFKEAIPLLLNTVMKNRRKEGCADTLYKLAVSYANTQDDLAASATSLYLATCFPKVENYATITLFKVGKIISNAAENEKSLELKDGKRDFSLILYEAFLATDSSDQYAGDVAYMIGLEYYNRAKNLAKVANDMAQGEERVQKAKEAIDNYKLAIPKLQRILDNYGNREQLVNSTYVMLPVCYQATKQFPEAAECHLKYCEREKEKLADVVNAKLSAANAYFQGGQYYDKLAKDLKEEILTSAVPSTDAAPAEEKKEEKKKDSESAVTDNDKKAPAEKTEEKKEASTSPAAPAAIAEKTENKEPAGDEKSSNPKSLEAEKLEAKAKELYKLAIKHTNELLDSVKEGGAYASVVNDPKVVKALETAYYLLGWTYDGAGEKNEACKAFDVFIAKYPKSPNVPACMMRMGTIYTELNNDTEAEKILQSLVARFPDSKEGKNATFFLGRSLYNIGKYDKSAKEFTKIFDQKIEVTPQNLRWIAANLSDCGGQHPKDCAIVALRASTELLARLDKLDKAASLEEWVGKERSISLQRDPKERTATLLILREKTLVDAGEAAFWAEDYKKAIECLAIVLANEKTPYYYDAKFRRADAYMKLKDYEKARSDLGELNVAAFGAKKPSIAVQAQCLIGESYLAENNYSKAFSSFSIIAATAMDLNNPELQGLTTYKSEEEKRAAEKEKEKAKQWVEQAVYKAAFCAAKLAKTDEKAQLVSMYKKNFPQGRFIKEIDALPAAEAANKP